MAEGFAWFPPQAVRLYEQRRLRRVPGMRSQHVLRAQKRCFSFIWPLLIPWSIDGVSYKSSSVKIRDFWWEGVHSSSWPVLPVAFMKWRMSSVIRNWEPKFFSWMLVGELSFPKNPDPSKKWRHFEDPDPYRFNPLHWRAQGFSGFLTSSCYVANRGTVILQGSFYKPFLCPEIGVYTPNHSIAPKNTFYQKSRNLNFILMVI